MVAAPQETGIGNGGGGHGFVAYAYLVAVPAAAGIGEVEGFVEINVKIGLCGDAQRAVIVFLPDGAGVPPAQRTAMHADGGDGNEFPEFFQVFAERFVGFVNIPAGQGQVFVLVADFMAEPGNFADDGFIYSTPLC